MIPMRQEWKEALRRARGHGRRVGAQAEADAVIGDLRELVSFRLLSVQQLKVKLQVFVARIQRRMAERGIIPNMDERIEPGEYVHYKGGRYTVIGTAIDSTDANNRNGTEVVIYVSHQGGGLRVRSRVEWFQRVTWPDGFGDGPKYRRCFPESPEELERVMQSELVKG